MTTANHSDAEQQETSHNAITPLVAVYALLLELAEEAKTVTPDTSSEQAPEKTAIKSCHPDSKSLE